MSSPFDKKRIYSDNQWALFGGTGKTDAILWNLLSRHNFNNTNDLLRQNSTRKSTIA